ncbi:MAG: glycogen debranching protein [Chloroflexi bacterium]|nr:glycogen debranching protein [Chloroflexota bacterium]
MSSFRSDILELLKDRIDLHRIPFSDRGARLMVFRSDDHFRLRLAERWFKLDGQLSTYRQRPPIVDGWRLTDGQGAPLAFRAISYPHRIDCLTDVGVFTLTFADPETLLLTFPARPCGVTFEARLDRARTDRRGGTLRLTGDIRRNIAYTTNAPIVRNEVASPEAGRHAVRLQVAPQQEGEALLLNITPRLGFNRYLPPAEEALEAAARRWHAWFAAAPEVEPALRQQYYYAWWIMRSGLISTRFYTTREAMTPSKIHYVGVWQWDAFFHALAYRHVDHRLAHDQLRILLDHQRDDGMIPDAVHDEGTVTHLTFPVEADVTKPPLLAWAAWKLHQVDGDVQFLNEIYEPIVRWNRWWFEKNDADGDGLCEYVHPFSSGLDDSPLWDDGMPVTAPDLNTYLSLSQEALANIAEVLGEREAAAEWRQRAAVQAQRMIERLWDPQAGLFWALHSGRRVEVRTPFNLYPLITGRMPAAIVDRLVAHLTNEQEFWTPFPVPTVARDDPRFDPQRMWRGPTWVNNNYLLIEGLERCGHMALAGELRRRTLDMVCGERDIYEYYHPLTGACDPEAASLFGWSAALFIDLAIQAAREAQSGKPPA